MDVLIEFNEINIFRSYNIDMLKSERDRLVKNIYDKKYVLYESIVTDAVYELYEGVGDIKNMYMYMGNWFENIKKHTIYFINNYHNYFKHKKVRVYIDGMPNIISLHNPNRFLDILSFMLIGYDFEIVQLI